jgi:hypothetical protein
MGHLCHSPLPLAQEPHYREQSSSRILAFLHRLGGATPVSLKTFHKMMRSLQRQFGFPQHVVKTNQDRTMVEYEFITVAS